MTAKTAPKITLWEFFSSWENLHVPARSVALVLRDHAGDRELLSEVTMFSTLLPWLDHYRCCRPSLSG